MIAWQRLSVGLDKFCVRSKKRRFERVGLRFSAYMNVFFAQCREDFEQGRNTGEFLEKRIDAK